MRWVHAGTRAVFFDAVGTVLFPVPSALAVYADAARRRGVNLAPETIRNCFLEAYRAEEEADRARGWVTSEARERQRWSHIVAASLRGVPDPDACFEELFVHFARPDAWRVNPDLGPVLEALRGRGLVLGVGSNYDARLWPLVAAFPELAPLRDRVAISAAVGFRKPAPEFFAEVVRLAGCEPGQVLFVGDDVANDYEGATAAGLDAVLLDDRGRHPDIDRRVERLTDI